MTATMVKGQRKVFSSVSKLHFIHYKAGEKSATISYVHALKTYVALKKGVSLG